MLASPSLNHLIRPRQQRWWDRQAESLGSLEVDDELELRRLLDRQVGGFRALEDLVHIGGDAPEHVGEKWRIGHQPPGQHVFLPEVKRRKPTLSSERHNLRAVSVEEVVRNYLEHVRVLTRCGREGAV